MFRILWKTFSKKLMRPEDSKSQKIMLDPNCGTKTHYLRIHTQGLKIWVVSVIKDLVHLMLWSLSKKIAVKANQSLHFKIHPVIPVIHVIHTTPYLDQPNHVSQSFTPWPSPVLTVHEEEHVYETISDHHREGQRFQILTLAKRKHLSLMQHGNAPIILLTEMEPLQKISLKI